MRKKWIGAIAALAFLTLLFSISPWVASPGRRPPEQQAKTRVLSASEEHRLKMADVKHDMDATSQLCASQCSKEIGKLLALAGGPAAGRELAMKKLMDKYPHMLRLEWMKGGSTTAAAGSVPKPAASKLQDPIRAARQGIQAGNRYQSSVVEAGGSRYMVLGIPAYGKHEGIIGLIRQDLVGEVQKHQIRNLRLVPYPAEVHYRIESVHAGSGREMTVRSGEDNGSASHYHVQEVVVRFRSKPGQSELARIRRDIDAVSENEMNGTYIFRSRSMDAMKMMAYFRKKWRPVYAEPHYLYLTNEFPAQNQPASSTPPPGGETLAQPIIPNDQLYSEYQWNLPSIEAGLGWNLSKGDNAVKIAVLDTGVQADHPDLTGKLAEGINIVTSGAIPDDDVGHGTHVAGIIAATVNNKEGVAGLTWYNKIMPVKVLDSSGAGSTYSVAQGLIWATDHGAKVINMSLGNYASAQFLHDAVKYAYDHDVVLIAASGNDNTNQPGYPAAYPEVFAVASTDSKGQKSSFSNYGDYIAAAAPGDSIASTYPGSQYAALSGTSMASPHAAALAGLIRSRNPNLTNVQVMDIMRRTAIDLGPKGKDPYFGYGQIDINKALLEAAGQTAQEGQASPTAKPLQTVPQSVKERLQQIINRFLSGVK